MATLTRGTLPQRLAEARAYTDRLFSIVRPEAYYDRPIPERHRIIFYLGHLEAFDWNLIGRGHFDLQPFAAEWDQLFSFGIDPVDGGLPTDQPQDWPRCAEILRYNERLRDLLDKRLEASQPGELQLGGSRFGESSVPGETRGHRADITTLLQVAIEHRLMHAETLAYILREMTSPEGAFYSTQDADSEGEEGRFFVWTPAQLRDVLGAEDGALAARIFGVVDGGNFEHGTTVLSMPYPLTQIARSMSIGEHELRSRLEDIRVRLRIARAARLFWIAPRPQMSARASTRSSPSVATTRSASRRDLPPNTRPWSVCPRPWTMTSASPTTASGSTAP